MFLVVTDVNIFAHCNFIIVYFVIIVHYDIIAPYRGVVIKCMLCYVFLFLFGFNLSVG